MGVFFGPLFDMLSRRGISQEQLSRECEISLTTIAQMRRGGTVPLETLDAICFYLDCSFGDIMTHVKDEGDPLAGEQTRRNLADMRSVYRLALVQYMAEYNFSIANIAGSANLSVNTVKAVLDGKEVSAQTCWRLASLGVEYRQIFDEKAAMYKQGKQLEDISLTNAIKKILKYAGDPTTMRYIRSEVWSYMDAHRLTKGDFCEQSGISIATLSKIENNLPVNYDTIKKVLSVLDHNAIYKIADAIDDSKAPPELYRRPRIRDCKKCKAFNGETGECYLLYKTQRTEDGSVHSAEECTHPKSYTAVYEEGERRNIRFPTPKNAVYIPAKYSK